jgi:hypothetical protein
LAALHEKNTTELQPNQCILKQFGCTSEFHTQFEVHFLAAYLLPINILAGLQTWDYFPFGGS